MSDQIPYFPYIISAFIGIGLAAATGFRVFMPMFAVSLASYLGWIPMNESFEWLANITEPATVARGTEIVSKR